MHCMLTFTYVKVKSALGFRLIIIITILHRLDEQPGSKWKPQLSSAEFQTLLSNLTAIKIRGTFGENGECLIPSLHWAACTDLNMSTYNIMSGFTTGRGYLDDVSLVSAKLGPGTPAVWVEKCRCPTGYDGQFCERCATGYRRRFPGQGPRSPCDPCSCQGGTCDPETGLLFKRLVCVSVMMKNPELR